MTEKTLIRTLEIMMTLNESVCDIPYVRRMAEIALNNHHQEKQNIIEMKQYATSILEGRKRG